MGFFENLGCTTIGVGCKGRETITVDQCEEIDKKWKEEFGEDYLTNRQALPATQDVVTYIAGTPCETALGYDTFVQAFCKADINNFDKQIGNGQTCADRLGTATRSEWCLLEKDRLRSDKKCSEDALADKYHSTASKWCQYYPEEEWCKCYNIKNKVCDINPNANGCKYYKALEQNRVYFGEEPKIENPEKPGEMIECSPSKHGPCPYSDGYKILKEKGHCRPRVCDRGYIPENAVSDCKPSYSMCGREINIRSSSDGDIIRACNTDFIGSGEDPDWMSEEDADSESIIGRRCSIDLLDWYNKVNGSKQKDKNQGPVIDFNKFPLNKLQMTCLPSKMKWQDSNFRHLTRYTISSSSSLCCLLLILLMSSLKRR